MAMRKTKNYDRSNMRRTILEFPKQFRAGLKSAEKTKVTGVFDGVVVCGIGGSALPADILKMWLKAYKIDLPLYIHRNYGLPHQIDCNHLVVCISYSGNTEEALSAFEEAKRRKLKIVAITSGGKLAELCKKHDIPFVKIPKGWQPRIAIGCQFAALIKVLANCGIINNELKDVLELESLPSGELENKGKTLAKKLFKKIPLIYAAEENKSLAYIWKISLNETAKIIASHNYLPELSHNEIVGFWKINEMQLPGSKLYAIFLKDPASNARIKKQMKIVDGLIRREGVNTETVILKEKDILKKTFSCILLAFWTSFHLALLYKVDPFPVKMIEEFKRRLREE